MQVDVSARTITVPKRCACCGEPPDSEITLAASRTRGKKVVRTTTRTWSFPYCSGCLAHVADWDAADKGCATIAVIALVLAGALAFGGGGAVAAVILALGIGGGLLFRAFKHKHATGMCSPACVCPERAVAYLGWNGSVQSFDIHSTEFAAAFLQSNQRKLVNVDADAAELLDQVREEERGRAEEAKAQREKQKAERSAARAQRSRSSRSAATNSGDEQEHLARCVARLEGLKGPAARRTALESALRTLKTSAMRERLLLEASKIEVQAALDKADSLKSAAAKRRTLQAALDEIKADSITDDLQAQQVAWLEAALADLETAPEK